MLISNFNNLTQENMNKIKLEAKVSNFLWFALYDNINDYTFKNGMIVPILQSEYTSFELSDKIKVEVDVQALLEGYNQFDYIDYYNFNDSKYSFNVIFNNETKIFNTKNMQDFILQLKVFLYKYLSKFQEMITSYEIYENEDDYIPLDKDIIRDINDTLVQEIFNQRLCNEKINT